MDNETARKVRRIEEQKQKLAERATQAESQRDEIQGKHDKLTKKFNELTGSVDEVTKAHREEIEDLLLYAKENEKFSTALQTIADGRGKYAAIAKRALGQ